MNNTLRLSIGLALSLTGAVAASQDKPVNPNAKIMAEFQARVDEYAKLRNKMVAAAPTLPKEATPTQIHDHQVALAAMVVKTRPTVKRGDLFVPEMEKVIHALMAQVFKNAKDRVQLRASIEEDNEGPVKVKLVVNGRYPDTVPLATMPPDVLKNLPSLPKDFEYRFVGESLILLDVLSNLIVDYMSFALPKA